MDVKSGAEVSKPFRDVQTKHEMKCFNEIWKLSGEEMVRTWFCTYLWPCLQAGWCCCQREFGATSAECCEKCMFLHFPLKHRTRPTGSESGVCRRGSISHRCVVSCFCLRGPSISGFISRPVWADQLLSTGRKRSGRISKYNERQWKSLANTMEVFVLFSREGKCNPFPLISHSFLHQN